MAVNIPQVPPYTGNVALRSNATTFPQDAEDQYTYLAVLSEDINAFSDAVNSIGTEFNDLADATRINADEAKASEDAALVSEQAASDSEIAAANSASSSSSSASSSLTSANASATSAIESSGFADDSAGSAQQSATSAAEAKLYRDQASEISGLDTVDEAVDLALDAKHFGVLSEAVAEAIRAQNKEQYAASGLSGEGVIAVVQL